MPNNQNPVFTDNTSITGDGTEDNPLVANSSGSVTEIESATASLDVTNPTGPVVDVNVAFPGGGFGGQVLTIDPTLKKIDFAPNVFMISNGAGGFMLRSLQLGDIVMLLESLKPGGLGVIFNCGAGAGGGPGTFIVDQSGSITGAGLHINFRSLQVFANNAAAIAGGLVAGDLYRSGADPDGVFVVH